MNDSLPQNVTDPQPAHLPISSNGTAAFEKIAIRAVSKTFHSAGMTVTALQAFNLIVCEGEFVCVVGPSGCGKTTLLRILADLETPTAGEIVILRSETAQPLTSLVFQGSSIFPWMRVRDNIGYGLAMRRVDSSVRQRVVDHFLDLTGLAPFADAFPHQLSGGMKQRVSVARAFANDPQILLMDEPFAALDEQTKITLQQELLKIWSETKKTVLFITHSIDEALVLADRIIVMSGSPGTIKADLPVRFARPRLVQELKACSEFGRMWHQIWSLLGKSEETK